MLRERGGRPATSLPPRRIVPVVGRSRPAIRRRVVVFPHPDGPSSTTNSPRATSRLKSCNAGRPWNTLEIECRLTALIAYRGVDAWARRAGARLCPSLYGEGLG